MHKLKKTDLKKVHKMLRSLPQDSIHEAAKIAYGIRIPRDVVSVVQVDIAQLLLHTSFSNARSYPMYGSPSGGVAITELKAYPVMQNCTIYPTGIVHFLRRWQSLNDFTKHWYHKARWAKLLLLKHALR